MLLETKSKMLAPGAEGLEKWRDISQRMKTSSYKMNNSKDLMYGIVIIVNSTASYTWKLPRE